MNEFNENDAREAYKILGHKQQTEIRLIKPKTGIVFSRFVTNEEDFVKVCKEFNGECNVYVGVNERKTNGTKKEDVITFNCIIIDVDPKRKFVPEDRGLIDVTKEAATQEEMEKAISKCTEIIGFLKEKELPPSLFFNSGNGGQIWLVFKEPIPINSENRDGVEANLKALGKGWADRFSDDNVEVDTTVFELARISKVPGTESIKGSNLIHRPHRLSKILLGGKQLDNESFKSQFLNVPTKKTSTAELMENYVVPLPIRTELERKYTRKISQGNRHHTYSEIYGSMNAQGYAREQILQTLQWFNLTWCEEPKTAETVAKEFEGLAGSYNIKAEDAAAWESGVKSYSDFKNDEIIRKFYGLPIENIRKVTIIYGEQNYYSFEMDNETTITLADEDLVNSKAFVLGYLRCYNKLINIKMEDWREFLNYILNAPSTVRMEREQMSEENEIRELVVGEIADTMMTADPKKWRPNYGLIENDVIFVTNSKIKSLLDRYKKSVTWEQLRTFLLGYLKGTTQRKQIEGKRDRFWSFNRDAVFTNGLQIKWIEEEQEKEEASADGNS